MAVSCSAISNAISATSFQRPYFESSQSLFLKRVAGEQHRQEDGRRVVEEKNNFQRNMRKQPSNTNLGISTLSKIENDSKNSKIVITQTFTYNDINSLRKSIQRKAANFSPLTNSKKQSNQNERFLEDYSNYKNPIKISSDAKITLRAKQINTR